MLNEKLKFISWNIAGGHTFKRSLEDAISYDEENINYFIDNLKKENADIVVFQEAHMPYEKGKITQSEVIAKQLGYSFIANHPYGRSHIKTGEQLSLSTISKFPIVNSYFYKIPNPKLSIIRPNGDKWISFDVGFLVCEVDYNGILINIINGHMVPFHYFQRDFLEPDFKNIRKVIDDFFVSLSGRPTLVGVDLNFNDIITLIPTTFKDKLYQEAFIGITTTPGRGQQDHILFSFQWDFINSEVKKFNTDHYLCLAEVNLNK